MGCDSSALLPARGGDAEPGAAPPLQPAGDAPAGPAAVAPVQPAVEQIPAAAEETAQPAEDPAAEATLPVDSVKQVSALSLSEPS